ncbi:MAG: carboxypeptidase-like regulatory domain-containing protein [Desulfuromonadaceae bacterium]|nr:carboxypeptidase-like regulatory domain-containing protein [Desulfuromonadaceae bacterium]
MRKRYLGLLSIVGLLLLTMVWGCSGGGGGGGGGGDVAKASISGTVIFPSLNSLVAKRVGLSTPPSVTVRNLAGAVVATATVTGSGTSDDPYTYSVAGLDPAVDYVVKVVSGGQVMKALVDKNALSTAVTNTRNIDAIATTAVLLAEKKLSVTPGTIGESSNSAVTTAAINNLQPMALESSIKGAVNTVLYASANATPANIELVNLAYVVAALVNTGVSPTQFFSASNTTPVTAIQYDTTATPLAAAPVTPTTAQSTLATTASSYTPPPVNSVSYASDVYDFTNSTVAPLSGVSVTTIGLSPVITTTTDANGVFVLAGIPQSTSFSVKMSKPGFADAYSNTFSLTTNQVISGRPYALYPPSNLTGWGNSTGNGVIKSRVVAATDLVSGYIGGAVVTATDKSGGTAYPVKYIDNATGNISSTLTATDDANGQYVVVNVPAGHVVDVTASKSGYTFTTRTFTVHADGVSQARVVGTSIVDYSKVAGTYNGTFTASDGPGGTFSMTVDLNGKLTASTSSGTTAAGNVTYVSASLFAFSATSSTGSTWTGHISTTKILDGTWSNPDGSSGTLTNTSAKFTAPMFSGKTYSFVISDGRSGTVTINSDGTANATTTNGNSTSSWVINSSGQLKITHSDNTYDLLTLTSSSATTITAIDQWVNPALPSDNWTGTITLTLGGSAPPSGFTSAMISGKTYSFVDSSGFSGTVTFNSDGTANATTTSGTSTPSWVINSSGQLKITHSDNTYDVLTITSSSATVITAIDQYVDPALPSDNWTGTMTLTLM